jgi:hypothetical protein
MEQIALRLQKTDGWTRIGSQPDARKPPEVVIRAFDGPVLAATGTTEKAPDGEPVLVPPGEGRRLAGFHIFARPAPPEGPRLITHRGLVS